MPFFSDATQPLLLSDVTGEAESLQNTSDIGWKRRRDIILFSIESAGWIGFSAAWAFLFVLPFCGKLFHCKCSWIWDSSRECLAVPRADSCPFCGSGRLNAASFIPQWGVVPIMVAAALLMRYELSLFSFLISSLYLLLFLIFPFETSSPSPCLPRLPRFLSLIC